MVHSTDKLLGQIRELQGTTRMQAIYSLIPQIITLAEETGMIEQAAHFTTASFIAVAGSKSQTQAMNVAKQITDATIDTVVHCLKNQKRG